MNLQLVVFATVKGTVQKTLIVHVDHQDHSAKLFVTKGEEITRSAHFYMSFWSDDDTSNDMLPFR